MDLSQLRQPPSSYEAERDALSCIFISPELINTSPLSAECFYTQYHKDIYEAMLALKNEGKNIDSINMIQKLTDSPYDPNDIYDVVTYAISSTFFLERCESLIEYANRRKYIKFAERIANCSMDMNKEYQQINEIYGSFSNELQNIIETKNLNPVSTFIKIFEEKKNFAITKTTGFSGIDIMLGGYRQGSLYIIGARPSMGKSTFALNMLLNLQDQGIRCAFFSTEMPTHEIHIRIMSNLTKIKSNMIEDGMSSIAEEVADKLTDKPRTTTCHIYDDFDTFENMEILIAKEASEGTKVIFVDYLQQIGSSRKVENLNNFIGMITSKLKKLAIKYGMCIICMAQLNRQAHEMKDPRLEYFRDSGNIEQDADVCMVLQSFDEHNKELDIHILKNRHGEKGVFQVGYRKECFYMYDTYGQKVA